MGYKGCCCCCCCCALLQYAYAQKLFPFLSEQKKRKKRFLCLQFLCQIWFLLFAAATAQDAK